MSFYLLLIHTLWSNSSCNALRSDFHCNCHYHYRNINSSFLDKKVYSFNIKEIKLSLKLSWVFPATNYFPPFHFDDFLNYSVFLAINEMTLAFEEIEKIQTWLPLIVSSLLPSLLVDRAWSMSWQCLCTLLAITVLWMWSYSNLSDTAFLIFLSSIRIYD